MQMTIDGNKQKVTMQYDSASDFRDDCESFVPKYEQTRLELEDSITRKLEGSESRESWYGLYGTNADTTHGAIKEIASGWDWGVAEMMKAFGELKTEAVPMSIKRSTVRSDYGDEYDIHAALAGQYDRAWTTKKRGAKRFGTSVRSIYVHCSINGHQSATEVFWRGAAALRLADMMTDAGYSVEIIAVLHTSKICANGGGSREVFITVKSALEQAELSAIASTICSATTLRYYGFKTTAKAAEALGMVVADNFGVTVYEMPKSVPSSAFFVNGYVTSKRDAIEWLNQSIKKLESGDE